jgi:hypothetical protein
MGRMFYDLRVLNSAEVISVSPKNFSSGYAGQAAQKTHELLLSAVGKTLFIDEAYGKLYSSITPYKMRTV